MVGSGPPWFYLFAPHGCGLHDRSGHPTVLTIYICDSGLIYLDVCRRVDDSESNLEYVRLILPAEPLQSNLLIEWKYFPSSSSCLFDNGIGLHAWFGLASWCFHQRDGQSINLESTRAPQSFAFSDLSSTNMRPSQVDQESRDSGSYLVCHGLKRRWGISCWSLPMPTCGRNTPTCIFAHNGLYWFELDGKS